VLPLVAQDAGLSRLAAEVTTPGSAQYAHYQSIPQLSGRFGATPAIRRRALAYLRVAGATDVRIDATGLFADATMTAGRAERLFATPLARFRAAHDTRFIAPLSNVGVPRGLRGAVRAVIGLDTRPLAAPVRVRPDRRADLRAHAAAQPSTAFPRTGTPSGCSAGVAAGEVGGNPATAGFTPNQYLTAYGFDQLHSAGVSGQGERVALIEIDGFKHSDIAAFAQCFGLHLPSLAGFGVGVRHPLAPGGESTLDLEALDAAAPDLKAIDVYETSANAANTLEAMTAPLQNRGREPQVISASLGLCEPAIYLAVGARGIEATQASLEMAAVSGVTFLAASGDSGSADCTGSDGFPIDRLAVNYPAGSPWVTGVGGTNLLLDPANGITTQVVWNDASVQPGSAGGGGSSVLFRRPFYQDGTVKAKSRALPDVSLLADIIPGDAFYCSAHGDCINSSNSNPWQAVGGTSAATPLLAGGFALVDQELKLHQRQALGLVNPLLYQLGRSSTLNRAVFDDVLSFGNDVGPYIPGNGQPLGCCSATPGYDRASGWGSINLASFAPIALLTQPAQIAVSLPGHQRPVKHGQLLATLSCTGPCQVGAYAVVRIARKKPFAVESRVYRFRSGGERNLVVRFSRPQLGRLRAALAAHRRTTATVFGVSIAGSKRVEFQTAGRTLVIRG
jgi:subtilase family serine protease